MRRALALARARVGFTTPNPSVGCVLVRGRTIVGQGATGIGGRPHAEVVALAKAGSRARASTAYVTLEPCSHTGVTPPCARALVDAGVARVVVGCVDPYPPVRGRGVRILRGAGISLEVGVLESDCRRVNEGFFSRVIQRRPFVILKLATTLDGRIAGVDSDSRWISSEASRAMVHRWRRECDAIVVGAGTVLADNPRLTCRIRGGRDPVRVIVDARLRTPPGALVFTAPSSAGAVLVTVDKNVARAKKRYARGQVEVLACKDDRGEIDLRAMMAEFGRRGWCKVLLEGGSHLAASALRRGIVDRVAFFLAPKIVGAGLAAVGPVATGLVKDSLRLSDLIARRVGDDILIEGRPLKRAHGSRSAG